MSDDQKNEFPDDHDAVKSDFDSIWLILARAELSTEEKIRVNDCILRLLFREQCATATLTVDALLPMLDQPNPVESLRATLLMMKGFAGRMDVILEPDRGVK